MYRVSMSGVSHEAAVTGLRWSRDFSAKMGEEREGVEEASEQEDGTRDVVSLGRRVFLDLEASTKELRRERAESEAAWALYRQERLADAEHRREVSRTSLYGPGGKPNIRSLVSQGVLEGEDEEEKEEDTPPMIRKVSIKSSSSKFSEAGEDAHDEEEEEDDDDAETNAVSGEESSLASTSSEEEDEDEDESEKDSDEDSDEDSEEDSEEETLAQIQHRRSSRCKRSLEEKSQEFKVVNLPQFQAWAQSSIFHQEMIEIPSLLEDIAHNQKPLPMPEDRLAPPRKLERAMSLKRSVSLETVTEPIVGRKDKCGDFISSMRLQRQRHKSAPLNMMVPMASTASMTSMTSGTSNTTFKSVATKQVGYDIKSDAVKQRANELSMPALLKKLAATNTMRIRRSSEETLATPPTLQSRSRHASAPAEVGSCFLDDDDDYAFESSSDDERPQPTASIVKAPGHGSTRKEMGKAANKFELRYAGVQTAIEDRISFRPLQRSHTISLGEREFRHRLDRLHY